MATLYVTEPGTQVRKVGERLVLTRGQDVLEEIPLTAVDQVVMVGRGVGLTTAATFALVRKGVEIIYLSGTGAFVASTGGEHKNSRLRVAQALLTVDGARSLDLAARVVDGKIHNQRVLAGRHAERAEWAGRALDGMEAMRRRAAQAQNLDALRGLEGQAAKDYFALLRRLLASPRDGPTWGFERRAYYPPTDPINALLSLAYTLLLKDMIAACRLAGLDPALGCFHAVDYGRPSMALDLIEPFRPIIADSLVLGAVNRRMVGLRDFRPRTQEEAEDAADRQAQDGPRPAGAQPPQAAGQGIYLTEEARARFLGWYEERAAEQAADPASGERTPYRRIFLLQAQAMAREVQDERGAYRPFRAR